MAHDLHTDKKTGKVAFVSGGNMTPWHGLGTVLPQKFLTAAECIQHACLDYEVALMPATMSFEPSDKYPNGTIIEVPGQFVTYRTDTDVPLGIVGDRYNVVQNTAAFSFFDNLVEQGEAIFETAGVLGRGERVFITAKMPSYIKVGKNDLTEIYVVLRMNHDGKGSIKAMITPIRVVCNNTLRLATKSAVNTVSIRHTTNANTKLEEAHQLLDISHRYVAEANDILNHLATIKVSDKKFKGLVESLFPSTGEKKSTRMENTHNSILKYYNDGPGQQEWMGTAYGAYNAITGYYANVFSYGSDEARFTNIMETTGALNSQKAFDMLLKMN